MKIALPPTYLREMQELLKERFPLLLAAYQEDQVTGLRVNPLKISMSDFIRINPFPLSPVPWCPTGFYYEKPFAPGKHCFHQAGLYYLQEPSAMKVVEEMAVKPGDYVLDLCAAPGGKATQIAGQLNNSGLLVANDTVYNRAQILSQNFERLAVIKGIVTNEKPANLAPNFPLYFDKVLVDAPCSGSGMFRKDPLTINQYKDNTVELCVKRQQEILREAVKMLKPGGRLVYSTCSFSSLENEEIVEWFLQQQPEFTLIKMERLWPFEIKGEGHFYAVFTKAGELKESKRNKLENERSAAQQLTTWLQENELSYEITPLVKWGHQFNLISDAFPLVDNLKVLRYGLPLGEFRNSRFIPHHSFALALSANYELSAQQTSAYLAGESFPVDHHDGWLVVGNCGYSLGWGKITQGILKNHYPKGLREH